jgi:hypothetical protein
MDADFAVQAMKVKDESMYELDGTTSRQRVYSFYLGKHGPFTERVPLANFDEQEIHRRIDTIKRQLAGLPQ